jgi:ferredoxin-NADP reductase
MEKGQHVKYRVKIKKRGYICRIYSIIDIMDVDRRVYTVKDKGIEKGL